MSRIPSLKLVCLLLFLGMAHPALCEEAPPAPSQPAPKPVVLGKRGTFYLSILSPIPATFGLGLTHYFGDYFGAMIELGKGTTVVYTCGAKLRPVAAKVSPILGLNASLGEEVIGAPRGYFYANTGIDWKWDNGMFLHLGLNWTLSKNEGATEMKPYLQIGLHY